MIQHIIDCDILLNLIQYLYFGDNMKTIVTRSYLLCAVAILLPYSNLAVSETTNEQAVKVQKIQVTGIQQAYQGDFEKLETPQSDLSISNNILQNAGANELTEALDLSASVARQNNFGGLWNSFALRGFVGDENLPSNFLVNGFNAGRGFGGPRDLSGVESIEVLKGPRAALFGRGEPGGTINLVSKRPSFEREGEVKLSAGSFDTYRTDLDWTSPVYDSLAVRLVGFYEDAGSFRDTIETTKQGLNPSVTWLIGDHSQFNYEIEYSEQEIPFDRGVIAIDNELGLIPDSRFLGEPGYGPIKTEVQGHQLEFQHDFDDSWSVLVGLNYRDTSLKGLASENGFREPDANGDFDRFSRYRDYQATYQVLRGEITGSFEAVGLKHRIIVGVDADEFENDQIALRDRDTDQSINVFNPVYGTVPEALLNLQTQIDRVETQESIGLYLQDQISLTDKLDIRLGVRFDDYKQELNNRGSSVITEQTESQLSPQLGAVYKSSEAVSFYATYGENFRPLSGADVNGNGFEPNQSTSFETGVNFELNNGKIIGNIANFTVLQENILGIDNSTDFNSVAIGEAQSRGLEIDLQGQITDDLQLWLSYAYTKAETTNELVEGNFGVTLPSGSPLLNIPENQLNIQLVKQMQLQGKTLNVGGGVLYVDERNGFLGTDFELPSYTTVRLFGKYEAAKNLDLRAEINNLFEEEYYVNSFANTWVQPGEPLNASVSAAYKF